MNLQKKSQKYLILHFMSISSHSHQIVYKKSEFYIVKCKKLKVSALWLLSDVNCIFNAEWDWFYLRNSLQRDERECVKKILYTTHKFLRDGKRKSSLQISSLALTFLFRALSTNKKNTKFHFHKIKYFFMSEKKSFLYSFLIFSITQGELKQSSFAPLCEIGGVYFTPLREAKNSI